MRQYKKMMVLCLSSVMALSLVACGDEEGEDTTTITTKYEQTTDEETSENDVTTKETTSKEEHSSEETTVDAETSLEDVTTKETATTEKQTTEKQTTTEKKTTEKKTTEKVTEEETTDTEAYAMLQMRREGEDFDVIDKVHQALLVACEDKEAYVESCNLTQLSRGMKLSTLMENKDNRFVQILNIELEGKDPEGYLSSEAATANDSNIYVVVRNGEAGVWIGDQTRVNETKYLDMEDEGFEIGTISADMANGKRYVELNIWVPYNMCKFFNEEEKWLNIMCKQFEAEHPELSISWKYEECSTGNVDEKLAENKVPLGDLYFYFHGELENLVNQDAILKFSSSMEDYVNENNSEINVEAVTYNGGIYGMPYKVDGWLMYCDKSALKDVDITSLDEILKVSNVACDMTIPWYMQSIFMASGCSFSETEFDFKGNKAEAALKYIIDNYESGKFVHTHGSISSVNDSGASVLFATSFEAQYVKEYLGDNYTITAMPKIDVGYGDGQLNSFFHTYAVGINPNAENLDVVIELSKFITSAYAQDKLYDEQGEIPCNTKLLEQEKYKSNEVVIGLYETIKDCSILQSLYLNSDNWWTPATDMCVAILGGDITDIEAEIEKFNKKINRALK